MLVRAVRSRLRGRLIRVVALVAVIGLAIYLTSNMAKSMPAKVAPQGPAPPSQPPLPKGFDLSESQQRLLDLMLQKWEKQSDKVKTFKCSFTRL